MKRNGLPACACNSTGCVWAHNNGASDIKSTNTRDLESDTVNSLVHLCPSSRFAWHVLVPWVWIPLRSLISSRSMHLDFEPLALREDRGFVGHRFVVFGDRFDGNNLRFPGVGVHPILNVRR